MLFLKISKVLKIFKYINTVGNHCIDNLYKYIVINFDHRMVFGRVFFNVVVKIKKYH